MLTIAYLTSRHEPHFEWFAWSLRRSLLADDGRVPPRIVIVDFRISDERMARFRALLPAGLEVVHVPPKPSVWQGPHRLTSRDYFAAANARNTAVCLATGDFLACVDDLSWLSPGWLPGVRSATNRNAVTAGSYKKVFDLAVDTDGNLVTAREHPGGIDSRWALGQDEYPVRMNGGGLYGCSMVVPVEAALQVNGWDEDTDSMGSEDYIFGLMAEHNGWRIFYDRAMMTLEDEMGHNVPGDVLLRVIKKQPPPDASHAILNAVLTGGRHRAPNYFGEGGLRAVRERVLAGGDFPPAGSPQHDWRDGQPLSEM